MVKPVVFQHFHFSAPLGSNMHQDYIFMKKYPPARAGTTFLQIGAQSDPIKMQLFGLDVPLNAFLPHLGRKADNQNIP